MEMFNATTFQEGGGGVKLTAEFGSSIDSV
jgi:hypothetical protein